MLWWLAQNTVTAALLACVVALLCRIGCFRPAVRHALWLVVLIKLLTPPVIVWPWALPSVFSTEQCLPSRLESLKSADEIPIATPVQAVAVQLDAPWADRAPPPISEPLSDVNL